jgi:hypothetical protein
MAFIRPAESDTLEAVHFDLAAWSNGNGDGVLAGRVEGERARAALEEEIGAQRSLDAPIAIDVRSVKVISVPFADGFFVPLLGGWLSGYYDEHPVVLLGAREDVAETVDAVLRLRSMAILSMERTPSATGSGLEFELLGGEPALQEVVRVAARVGKLTATDLADELGITAQAANNRLRALVRLGALARVAVHRVAGGREFEYRLPAADAEVGDRTAA